MAQARKRKPIPVKIRPIYLYVDTGPESQEAITLLAATGIPMDVIFTTRERENILPRAIHSPWVGTFDGIKGIRELREWIDDEAERKTGGLKVRDPSFPQLVIRYDLLKTKKSLSEIRGYDIPIGFGTIDAVLGR